MYIRHEGNIEEENNSYVVFKRSMNQLGRRWQWGEGGIRALLRPSHSLRIDIRDDVTGFPTTIFASGLTMFTVPVQAR
jgi:hypothetical protein